MNILATLREKFRPALTSLTEHADELLEMIRPAQDPRFGDYQANCAMPLGKRLGKPPREVATEIVNLLQLEEMCEPPEVAGPGFINLRLKESWLVEHLERAVQDPRLGIVGTSQPRTIVIDYSSPNVAKPMHVGHIRSTVIGDALCRTLRFMGHHAISDNHLGDWGTQFGMIIYGYKHFANPTAYEEHPVAELGRLYKLVHQLVEYQEALRQLPEKERQLGDQQTQLAARQAERRDKPRDKQLGKLLRDLQHQVNETHERCEQLRGKIAAVEGDLVLAPLAREHAGIDRTVLKETAKLHEGDAENITLWQKFLPQCKEDIQRIYARIGIEFDHELGESFYHDRLEQIVTDLKHRGLRARATGPNVSFCRISTRP